MKKQWFARVQILSVVIALCFLGSLVESRNAGAKTLKLGTNLKVTRAKAKYSSANNKIASVNQDGIVTAKKLGTTTIEIKGKNYLVRKQIKVVANGSMKRPLYVAPTELKITKATIEYGEYDAQNYADYTATISVKNKGKHKASKVVIQGIVNAVVFDFELGNIPSGATRTVKIQGKTFGEEEKVIPVSISLNTNGMSCKYQYQNNKSRLAWSGPDKTPPVISGFVGKNSYNKDTKGRLMPYRVVYIGEEDTYNFKKYVTVKDERSKKVYLKADTSKVDFSKAGIYTIHYTATDEVGNEAKATAKIQVRKEKEVDQLAKEVLTKKLKIKPGWSVRKKAEKIYNYTRNSISYIGYSNKSSWEAEAIRGFRNGKGDCFTYYSVARALLTRAEIPNIEVTRVRGVGHHWWNMVYTGKGWYHYDCGPRSFGGRFCLVTDNQLTRYSKAHNNLYIWAYKKKPKTPKKRLSYIYSRNTY